MNSHRLTYLIFIVLFVTPTTTFASSMVMIPEGPFTMGQGKQPPYGPERRLFLKPFLIDQSEVTNEEFAKFVADHKPEEATSRNASSSNRPSHSKAPLPGDAATVGDDPDGLDTDD